LSDHTIGSTLPIIATALGASVIEKHFILDRKIGGPDASFSMNEQEFTKMVKQIRSTEKALGSKSYELTRKQVSAKAFSRSLYVCKDINRGEIVTSENIKSVRPGYSLHPKHLNAIIGKKANKNLVVGDRIKLSDFE